MNIREKVLIVEDEKGISQFIAAALSSRGYEAIQAHTGAEALTITPAAGEFDCDSFLCMTGTSLTVENKPALSGQALYNTNYVHFQMLRNIKAF